MPMCCSFLNLNFDSVILYRLQEEKLEKTIREYKDDIEQEKNKTVAALLSEMEVPAFAQGSMPSDLLPEAFPKP